MSDWIYFLVFGAIAGGIGNFLIGNSKQGLIANIITGVAGAVIGGFVFNFFNIEISGGIMGSLIKAVSGAVILIFVLNAIRKR